MRIFIFKVKDFTTIMVGQMHIDKQDNTKVFYVQQADGTTYNYPENRVEYYKEIKDSTIEM